MKLNFLVILVLLVAAALSACSGLTGATPTPLPTVVLDRGSVTPGATAQPSGGGVTASGYVVPAKQAELVFTISGKVEAAAIALGQSVREGDVLIQLQGKEDIQASIAAADLELATAQKALDDLRRDAGGARTAALERIAAATQAERDAAYQLDNFTIPSNQANLDTRQALEQMEARLEAARAAFEPFRYYPSTNSTRENLKEKLDEAQADYNAAVRRLQYETQLEVARADLQDALQDFELWNEGPDPAELSLAEKRLANAQAAADAARAKLESLELRAPFDGVITALNVHPGEWVTQGQAVIAVADLARLRVETNDLSERDVPGIVEGGAVAVFIKALGLEVAGHVREIAPLADTLGGDVVYRTTIELDSIPPGLRAGMSVEVHFE